MPMGACRLTVPRGSLGFLRPEILNGCSHPGCCWCSSYRLAAAAAAEATGVAVIAVIALHPGLPADPADIEVYAIKRTAQPCGIF